MVPTTDSVALPLRFREHELPCDPPDVAAFLRSRAPSSAAHQHRHREDMGVLAGSGQLQPRGPVVVFFQHAGYGIPAIESGCAERLADVGSWSLRPTLFGYLARVPPPRREPQRPRAAWIAAACLPLLALPWRAEAAPEREPPSVQRPQKRPSVPPPPGSEAEAEAEAEATPALEPGPEAEPVAEPGPGAEPGTEPEPLEPSLVSTPPPAEPTLRSGTATLDPATVDAAWEGVDGFDVELELKGGREMSGRVGAVQRDTFTLIQAGTGAVLVLPKSGVVSLRVRTPAPLPAKNGAGALIGGGILTAVGTPVFISGVAFLAACPSCAGLHIPLLLVGGGALGAGIPLLVRGSRTRKIYREALQERALAPVVMRTPHGWTGGLRFRF